MSRPRNLSKSQINKIPELRKQGWSYKRIGSMFGVSKTTVSRYCIDKKENEPIATKDDDFKVCSVNYVSSVSKEAIEKNLDRCKKVKALIESIEPKQKITLQQGKGRQLEQISGIVQTKYPGKLLILNDQGRPEMITLADILTMKVKVG